MTRPYRVSGETYNADRVCHDCSDSCGRRGLDWTDFGRAGGLKLRADPADLRMLALFTQKRVPCPCSLRQE
jgi:hypothetical protein